MASWRGGGGPRQSGSNDIPLGNKRRFGGRDAEDNGYDPSAPSAGLSEHQSTDGAERGRRRKRNRWGNADVS